MKHQLLSLSCMVMFLSACNTTTSVVTTGASAIYDRHNLQQKWSDQKICIKAYNRICNNKRFANANVSVSTFNNVVLITGQIPTSEQRKEIENIVKNIPEHGEIYNLSTISRPISMLTQMGDSWITAKIKSKFIAEGSIDPSKIKVITEDGTVYLMGTVQPEQANLAVELARTTEGVQSVVKIFSYITISKCLT